jgi:hypothetical protein
MGTIHKRMIGSEPGRNNSDYWILCTPSIVVKAGEEIKKKFILKSIKNNSAFRWSKVNCPKCLKRGGKC